MGAMKRLSAASGRSGKGFMEVQWFLDKPAVVKALDRAARRVLSRFGAFVRQTSRQSIRKPRKLRPSEMTKAQRHRWHQMGEPALYAPSRPGEPPRNRTGKLRGNIFFWYDLGEWSVTIGPASFKRGDTPGIIEHGGRIITGPGRGRMMDARPYMGPAMQKELPKLLPMWRNSIKPY